MALPIGIHPGIAEAVYHADPAESPSASSSILKIILDQSPEHAWFNHPRLNPKFVANPSTTAQNNGTVLHSLILETPAPYRVLDVKEYKTNEAKALRDATLAEGLIPVKAADMEELQDVASSLRARIRLMPDIAKAIAAAEKEVACIWRQESVLTRCRFDILPPAEFGFTGDLKFTSRSAEPEGFSKKIATDYAMQGTLYPTALKSLRGDEPEFLFFVCETDPPYGVSIHGLSPALEDMAREKMNRALDLWSRCLKSGKWPGYPREVFYADPLPWELARWETWKQQRDFLKDHPA